MHVAMERVSNNYMYVWYNSKRYVSWMYLLLSGDRLWGNRMKTGERGGGKNVQR